jgi:hypothetical protein
MQTLNTTWSYLIAKISRFFICVIAFSHMNFELKAGK